jgi:hypothetical protein
MKCFFQKNSITRRREGEKNNNNCQKFVPIFGFKCVAKDIEGQLKVFKTFIARFG